MPGTDERRPPAHRVLEAASAVGASHLVLRSSAAAYGAWANNPVPLTEERPAATPTPASASRGRGRPSSSGPARTGATITRAPRVAMLRPVAHALRRARLARRGPRASARLPVADEDPPAQYLDIDDLAAAVDLARRARLDGPRNALPDGWVDGDTTQALAGGAPRASGVPSGSPSGVAGLALAVGPGRRPRRRSCPYTVHPWVVANDRLRRRLEADEHPNEEALRHPPRGRTVGAASPPVAESWAGARRRWHAGPGAVGVVALVPPSPSLTQAAPREASASEAPPRRARRR